MTNLFFSIIPPKPDQQHDQQKIFLLYQAHDQLSYKTNYVAKLSYPIPFLLSTEANHKSNTLANCATTFVVHSLIYTEANRKPCDHICFTYIICYCTNYHH